MEVHGQNLRRSFSFYANLLLTISVISLYALFFDFYRQVYIVSL